MARVEIEPFAEEHLDAAARLLAERHRRHRQAEPLLPEAVDYQAEVAGLLEREAASGVVAVRDGQVGGYLIGVRRPDEVWGPNVWIEVAGHAAEEPETVRDLYAAAAERWVDEGRTRHYALVPATDDALLDAWYRLCFGQQHAHGIREVPERASAPDGVREAGERDVDALLALDPLLPQHQAQSPVFGGAPPQEDEEALRKEIADDIASAEVGNPVAELDGRIVGNFVVMPVERSSSHAGLGRPDRAAYLAWAATLPEVRGTGVGLALTEAALAWAREHGYETIVTDWRVTNLLSSRFWPRRGFRPTFLRLYRSIP